MSCPINNLAFVAIKMGHRSGDCPCASTLRTQVRFVPPGQRLVPYVDADRESPDEALRHPRNLSLKRHALKVRFNG